MDSFPSGEQIIEVAVDHCNDISNVDRFHVPALFSKPRGSGLFVQKYDDRSVGVFDVNVGRFVFIASQDGDSRLPTRRIVGTTEL